MQNPFRHGTLKCSLKACTSVAIITNCVLHFFLMYVLYMYLFCIFSILHACCTELQCDNYCSVLYVLNTVTFFFQEVLEGKGDSLFPAARVLPTNGELFWLVDDPAAASLTIQVERLSSVAKL